MEFQDFFKIAMNRNVPYIYDNMSNVCLNLGAGNKIIRGIIPLDYPDWDADKEPIPYKDESVGIIYAFHFLEHCQNPVKILQECQRVMITGGILNICTPYYTSQMQAHDLDHKHFFCEDTYRILFNNPYYDKNRIDWKFEIGFNLICGIVERNLCLLTQLIKKE